MCGIQFGTYLLAPINTGITVYEDVHNIWTSKETKEKLIEIFKRHTEEYAGEKNWRWMDDGRI